MTHVFFFPFLRENFSRENNFRSRIFVRCGVFFPVDRGCLLSVGYFILAGGHVRASAGALAVHGTLILAGCHVRASAGDLAVHGALIPRVCVCVCVCLSVCPVSNSFLITQRIGTRLVSVDR